MAAPGAVAGVTDRTAEELAAVPKELLTMTE
jgi:hypothetical protein